MAILIAFLTSVSNFDSDIAAPPPCDTAAP
jgi:hypothetical protein